MAPERKGVPGAVGQTAADDARGTDGRREPIHSFIGGRTRDKSVEFRWNPAGLEFGRSGMSMSGGGIVETEGREKRWEGGSGSSKGVHSLHSPLLLSLLFCIGEVPF
ncbi:hypothetical protein R1sor_012577 [Riccia sorocarpa]|uniref:Uncharacterized protein n=1 Tax=Riccia sorocarpa TaxID=122646 RepID=A0ABD3I896_9MARC